MSRHSSSPHRPLLLLLSFTVTILASAIAAIPAIAAWHTQSPLPTSLDIRGVAAPTPGRVFLATDDNAFDAHGALLESSDGGATWTHRAVPGSLGDALYGVFFLDAQRGWTWGNFNYRTIDGGTTWTELPALGSTYSMKFHTPSFGIASGNFGLMVSRNGGLSWQASPGNAFAFDFASAEIGLGAGPGGILRTTDGGQNFSLVRAGDAKAVEFLSATVAVGIVADVLVRSTDGGATWNDAGPALGRTRLAAVAPEAVLAWGRSGDWPEYDDRLLRSGDGGATWTDVGEAMPAGTLAMTPVTAGVMVAADLAGNLFRSANAGATWAQVFASPGPTPGFFGSTAPVFADATTGYFGYGTGFVLGTTDGGASWSQISSGSGRSITDLVRFADGDMVAVGEWGTVLTGNGTEPWRLRHPGTAASFVAAHAVGTDVLAAEENGRIHRSTDRGLTWTAGTGVPGGLSSAADVHFTSSLDGWVVGSGFSDGALFHTVDGGATWTPVESFLGSYVAVDFEGLNGWAVNVNGVVQRSIDGGATWTGALLPDAVTVSDVEFFDESIGYAVGWYGYAARSADAGMTWEVLPVPNTTDKLTDIFLVGANELWVSTASGRAWYSATGGQNWAVLNTGTPGFGSFSAIVATTGGDAWMAGFQGAIEHFEGPPPPPENRPPAASFTFATTGLSVALTDHSTDPDGTIIGWIWDFGDATGSTEQNPTHLFAAAGTYIVRLTVVDEDSATGSAVRFIVVQPGPGGTYGHFTEVTPLDPLLVTPQDEDFWVSTTAPADFDGDGDLDIAVLGYYVVYNESVVHRLVMMRNDGAGAASQWSFEYLDVPLGALSTGASDLAWGDVDGDGDQDLAVGSDGQTVLYRNDAGTLVATDTALPGYFEDNLQANFDLNSISWADVDNDGDLDLLVPSVYDFDTGEYRTALMRNDGPNGSGGWTFTETSAGLAPTIHAQSAWADADGDRDLDLLLVHLSPLDENGFIRVYRNDGGTFVGQDVLGGVTVEHGEAQWGDYDADGDLDILLAGNLKEAGGEYTNALRVYRNDAGTYAAFEVIPDLAGDGWYDLTAATWADYDSDGDVDILLTGDHDGGSQIEGRAKIFDNAGGSFVDSGNQLPAPRASGSRGGTFGWLDLDGDGDLDYFIAGEYFVPGGNGLIEAQVHVYRNDAGAENQAPGAASGLAASVNGDDVQLTWNEAEDDLTAAAALTYDVEVQRSGMPVATPARLPQPGAVGAVNQWSLSGLADGTYTWKLRAIDTAYNGGPVAQGSFVIGSTTSVDALPAKLEFSQLGANPFRAGTTFRFALPKPCAVELSVFDVAGRRVGKLAGGPYAAGMHDVRWEAAGLPSGVYVVRFSAPGFTRVQRAVLMR